MSNDEVSEYENDSLIKEKRIIMKDETDKVGGEYEYGLLSCIYKCIVVSLLLIILFVMIGSIVWFYLSVNLQSVGINSIPLSVERIDRLSGLRMLENLGMSLESLPNNTVKAIYDYDDEIGITQDQEDALFAIFDLFDMDDDKKWSLDEFKLFIDGAIMPELNFDEMDLDDDGVVSMKEIYLIIQVFDSTDIYECGESDNILYNIFNYTQNNDGSNRNLFYEYIGQLWLYQLDKEEIGVFSKADYIKYIDEEEWKYHNRNNDDKVEFEEFRHSFFGSIYYQSWKKSMQFMVNHQVTMNNIYGQLDVTDDATISALKLTTRPHEYDTSIDEYINNNNNNQHGPSVSLLYVFPNLYFAHNLIHESTRRRFYGVCTTDYDCCFRIPCFSDDDLILHQQLTDENFLCIEGMCEMVPMPHTPECTTDYDCCWYIPCVTDDDLILNQQVLNEDWRCIDSICEFRSMPPTPAPIPTPYPTPSPPRGKCFSEKGKVDILVDNIVEKRQLKDVKVGQYIFDGTEFTKIIAVERGGIKLEMIKLFINDTFIILTDDHLLYGYNDSLIRSGDLKIGDKIYNDFVIDNVEYNLYETPSTPITMSGMIEVNGIKASCYIYSSIFADLAHNVCLAPFRFLSEYVSEYYAATIIEKTIPDLLELYYMRRGPQRNEKYLDLLFVFDIHPIFNLIIVCLTIPIFYGKYMILSVLSFFM